MKKTRNAGTQPVSPVPQRTSPVSLHIDKIVLEGFTLSTSQRGVFQTALENELTHLLTRMTPRDLQASFPEGGSVALRTLPLSATLPPNASPTALGRDLARTLYAGLGTANITAPSARTGDKNP